jgi:hypothetical protein
MYGSPQQAAQLVGDDVALQDRQGHLPCRSKHPETTYTNSGTKTALKIC